MAKVGDTNAAVFTRRQNLKKSHNLSSLILSDFVSSSSTMKPNYPFNYPYNIYNNSFDTPTMPFRVDIEEVGEEKDRARRDFWWWQPDQESIPSEFLEASSMHGLKYVSQPKRHLIERAFWLFSFISCVIGAALMIKEIWQRYYENPVIVTFNPTEQDVDSIPFPAITICNTNPFKLSRVERYAKRYKEGKTKEEREAALDALRVINAICSTQQSFLKSMNFASKRGEIPGIPEAKLNPSAELEKNLTQFLLRNSQPCRELIRLCTWGQEPVDCEKLFKPIITDYGKCCTFNSLPQQLMEHYTSPTSQTIYGDDPKNSKPAWSDEEIKQWGYWDYNKNGYILSQKLKFPLRQRRAGTVDGLSVLLDPDLNNTFCPTLDSMGVKVLYHVALDAPRVADLGQVVGVDKEVFMEVNPDLTIADDTIQSFHHETRKCYFGKEFTLNFYRPYTRSNCMEECFSEILLRTCRCVLYYTPRNSTTSVCSTNTNSTEYQCVRDNERKFLGKLHKVCNYCKYSCNDLEYNAEVTYAELQPKEDLWPFEIQNNTKQDWMDHQISILHIFIGADSTVPKLRQKLYQTVDLIANTGGLLGLSIGFSVLSAVEIIYFATMRICCRRMRKSNRFGPIRSTAAPPSNEANTTAQNQAHQNNGDMMDNRRFLRRINTRNFIQYQ